MTAVGNTAPRPDTTWTDHAACAHMPKDDFFPERGDVAAVARAKAVCRTCPVQAECLDEALANVGFGDHGIWGGTSGKQRRAIRRRRNRAA